MNIRSVKVILGFSMLLGLSMGACMMDNDEDFPDFNEQLQKDIAAIDSYLASKNIVAKQDPSGIRYVVIEDSVGGKKITVDSCVTASYRGRLLSNDQEFDKGTNISFPLNGVIDGWKIGIPLLNEGDSAVLYIPSGLAYGYYGYPPEIPSNANLIFNVAVKKVGSTYSNSNRSCN